MRKINNLPNLSKIGFGSIAIGGGFGPIDDNQSIITILKSFEQGINWIDTAPIYGLGHAEEVIGKALKEYKEHIFVATKCGLYLKKNQLAKDLRPETIFREIDESLKRLQVPIIDLYQCHWPDFDVPVEETWEAMAELVKQGKVRYIGVCNFSINLLEKILPIYPIFSVQGPLSLFDNRSKNEIIPYCWENNINFLAYRPLQFGLLSGSFNLENLAQDDFRRQRKEWFGPENLDIYMTKVHHLKEIASKKSISLAQLAISWVTQYRGVAASIVGMRSTTQVLENTAPLKIIFTEEEEKQIEEIVGTMPASC